MPPKRRACPGETPAPSHTRPREPYSMNATPETDTPVYHEFLDPVVLAKIENMELVAKFIVEGFMIGLHRSPYHGFSVEFSSYRKYAPGDELKFVDWRVFGRTDKFYVKQFEETTNLNCYLTVDTSGSMKMAEQGISKLRYASYIAASLSYLMLRQSDAVSLTLIRSDETRYIPPSGRTHQLQTILAELSRCRAEGETDLGAGLARLAERTKGRSMIVLISDLLAPPEDILDALKFFRYRNHEVICFHVLTTAERTFPYGEQAEFVDMETGQIVATEPTAIRKEYLNRLREHVERIRHSCEDYEIDFVSLRPSDMLGQALATYLGRRAMLY